MANLIITIPPRLDGNEAKFMQSWLESLEPCQNIISVVEQWDNQNCPRIDPAIVSPSGTIQFQYNFSIGRTLSHVPCLPHLDDITGLLEYQSRLSKWLSLTSGIVVLYCIFSSLLPRNTSLEHLEPDGSPHNDPRPRPKLTVALPRAILKPVGSASVPYTYVLRLSYRISRGNLLLADQFKRAQNKYKDTRLTCAEIDYLLSKFKTPLHPKTLERLLATPTTASHTNTNNDMTMQLDDLWSFDVHDLSL